MPNAEGRCFSDALVRRGLALAERRLLDLSALYRSGRWPRYYETQAQFAAHLLDAIKVANVWAKIADKRPLARAPGNRRSAA